jgi:hypothetical protein
MMPISTAAPKTGRDIPKRVLLALLVAFAALPSAATARVTNATPVPISLPPGTAPMGYYMMQGSHIVNNTPFPNVSVCFKAVAALMKTLPANTAPIVCAHRRPE